MRGKARCIVLAAVVAGAAGCRGSPVATTLWFGGDVHVGAGLAALIDSVPSRKDGIGIVNLEGPIDDGPAASLAGAEVRLRQAPQTPVLLAAAGVRVATLANNHALDAGESGRERTVNVLRARGIAVAYGEHVAVLNTPSGVVSVAAFDLTSGVPIHLGDTIRHSDGLRVVTLHVTAPSSYLPAEVLERAVAVALEAGARVVVAHGTHEPARVERRGDRVIAWGLGNLVFDCECTDGTDGLLLAVTAHGEGVLDAAVFPIRAGLGGVPARPSEEPDVLRRLLVSLRSSRLSPDGAWLRF
jgi:poly-gamma-glutamate capsule biosynthesis protein CapA/YwtB (metallophosphatase superfamily)